MKPEAAQNSDGRFRVEFEALNTGDEAAADVHFIATLRSGETEIETQDVSVDLLPANSSKRAGIFFTHDPDEFSLEIVASGYQRP